jgi:hypothetical protein
MRCVEILEHVGTPAAQQVLRVLAGGASQARLTVQARAALNRLASRNALARRNVPGQPLTLE